MKCVQKNMKKWILMLILLNFAQKAYLSTPTPLGHSEEYSPMPELLPQPGQPLLLLPQLRHLGVKLRYPLQLPLSGNIMIRVSSLP